MDWCRLWHDMTSDPKWRVVSRRSGRPITEVVSVYIHMMTVASAASDRGRLDGWDDEDVAALFDLEPEHVEAIRQAMQGKVLDGDRLTGWERRQPKRERDESSADRVRAHRERKAATTAGHSDPPAPSGDEASHVTPCNATKRHETPPEESREDKITTTPPSPPAGGRAPRSDEIDREFDRFWRVWQPARGGAPNPRKPARDRFAGAMKRGVDPDRVVQGAEADRDRLRKTGAWGTDKAPQGVTWISQERWEDALSAGVATTGADPPADPQARLRSVAWKVRKRITPTPDAADVRAALAAGLITRDEAFDAGALSLADLEAAE